MKKLLTLFALFTLAAAGPVLARPVAPGGHEILRLARSAIVVPAQWDGIWTTLDSTYTCEGAFDETSTGSDTICGGKDYDYGAADTGFTLNCTGSATATTFDMTCSGSGNVFTDCDANYQMVVHGTLSGSSYHVVSTFSISYVGTGTGCEFLPATCFQTNSWGTRVAPAPPSYCATPVRSSTWGQLKSIYR